MIEAIVICLTIGAGSIGIQIAIITSCDKIIECLKEGGKQ